MIQPPYTNIFYQTAHLRGQSAPHTSGISRCFAPLNNNKGAEVLRNTTDMQQKMKVIHTDFNYFREARALVTCVFFR